MEVTNEPKREAHASQRGTEGEPHTIREKMHRLTNYIATWKSRLVENDLAQRKIRAENARKVGNAGNTPGEMRRGIDEGWNSE